MRDVERFWARVDRSEGCWLWTGCVINNGYGQGRLGGKTISTHRIAWTVTNGPIPEGAWVLHHCDVKLCVNPTHLYLGTAKDNTHDSIERGHFPAAALALRLHPERRARGERNGLAKLTSDDVRQIRQLAGSGVGQKAIGARFGVTQANVSSIVCRHTWAHTY